MTEIIPIVDAYGTSWVLNINPDQGATTGSGFITSGTGSVNVTQWYTAISLEWDHPEFGILQYTERESHPWICDNTNTLFLRTKGTLPDGILPQQVCIIPRFVEEPLIINCYENPADNGNCCDPCTGFVNENGTVEMKCNGEIATIRWERGFRTKNTDRYKTDIKVFRAAALGPVYAGISGFMFTTGYIMLVAYAYCTTSGWVVEWWLRDTEIFDDPQHPVYSVSFAHVPELSEDSSLNPPEWDLCEKKLYDNTCCPLHFEYKPTVFCKKCPPPLYHGVCCDPDDHPILRIQGLWGTGGACKPAGVGDSLTINNLTYEPAGGYWRGSEADPVGTRYTTVVLYCGFDIGADDDAPPGMWSMAITRSDAGFATCIGGVYYFEPVKNQVECPGVALNFGSAICDEDYDNGACDFLSNVYVSG